MKTHEIGTFIGAVLFACLVAMAMDRGLPVDEAAAAEAKAELLEEPDFMMLHNAVYAKVGERRWAGEIKPEFMRELTVRTIRDTGDPFPDWKRITDWAKNNPAETKSLLERHLKPLE